MLESTGKSAGLSGAIVKSIEEFGMNDPIGIWSDENIIVEGHGRLLACLQLGMEEVPCIRLDHMTDEQRRAYALAHNKTAELSAWDDVLLPAELKDIKAIDMTAFGFVIPEEVKAVDDEYEPEIPDVPKTKLGDIYQLGKHRLMCGSSTSAQQVETLMGGVKADMLLTDPPYGVDYEGGTGMKIENDKLKGDEFLRFLSDAFTAANEVMKPGAVFYIWHADSNGQIFRNACEEVGWTVRQWLILTGRKIVCDQYGGYCPVGGGAFSGKDPTKVDRSGAYMARHIAKELLEESEYLTWVEVQLAYAIGVSQPVSINVKSNEERMNEFLSKYLKRTYDLTPNGMINFLHLYDVDYGTLAEGCHYR